LPVHNELTGWHTLPPQSASQLPVQVLPLRGVQLPSPPQVMQDGHRDGVAAQAPVAQL
jgi:hypothetical protein